MCVWPPRQDWYKTGNLIILAVRLFHFVVEPPREMNHLVGNTYEMERCHFPSSAVRAVVDGKFAGWVGGQIFECIQTKEVPPTHPPIH